MCRVFVDNHPPSPSPKGKKEKEKKGDNKLFNIYYLLVNTETVIVYG